jgi:hypothetical protein
MLERAKLHNIELYARVSPRLAFKKHVSVWSVIRDVVRFGAGGWTLWMLGMAWTSDHLRSVRGPPDGNYATTLCPQGAEWNRLRKSEPVF